MSGPGTRLVLWRHGRTGFNAQHRFQGRRDVPLDEIGLAQARAAAPHLAALGPAAIISSPLSRALGTAEALAGLTGLPVERDGRLVEVDVGDWAGLTPAEAGVGPGRGPGPGGGGDALRV